MYTNQEKHEADLNLIGLSTKDVHKQQIAVKAGAARDTSAAKDVKEQRERRPPVTLESDAVYEGEWIGENRDGYGK